jgi:hypothetical protein
MKIQDIGRLRLAELIQSERYGSQSAFVERTGENQGEISALLKDKSFGEKKARKIDGKCGLPEGWLDQSEGVAAASPPAPKVAVVNDNPRRDDADEIAQLITLYGESTETGRKSIMTIARSTEKLPRTGRGVLPSADKS